jgi:hypothetical protein
MGTHKRDAPAIHGRIEALQKEAAALGDSFLEYLFAMAVVHLENQTDTLALLHKEPSVRSPQAKAWLRQLWPPAPRRTEQPQEGTMQLDIKCQSCRYWTGKDTPVGECRRMPPISSSILHGKVMSAAQPIWPATNADDWCGEWQGAGRRH